MTTKSTQEARAAFLFLIPAFVGLTVLTYGPLIVVFALSFFNWRGALSPSFIGILNYVRLFTEDPYFIDSIKVTCYFSVLAVICSMI
jgi:multiple sugar transport system permease protein